MVDFICYNKNTIEMFYRDLAYASPHGSLLDIQM